MVQKFSQTSKQYVDNYLKTAVDTIKLKKDNDLCYGSKTPGAQSPTGAPTTKVAESAEDVGGAVNSTLDSVFE